MNELSNGAGTAHFRPAGAGTVDGEPQPDSVDKIRDIIFGSQMRDYEKKFSRLEERLLQETADLRADMQNRFASLEALLRSEANNFTTALNAEKTERGAAVGTLRDEIKTSTQGWERRAGQQDEGNAKAQAELRQLVTDQARRLAEEFEQKHATLAASQGRDAQEIRAMLTDRFALADLFSEVALRLKHEPKHS